jgi:hypothetical protein
MHPSANVGLNPGKFGFYDGFLNRIVGLVIKFLCACNFYTFIYIFSSELFE